MRRLWANIELCGHHLLAGHSQLPSPSNFLLSYVLRSFPWSIFCTRPEQSRATSMCLQSRRSRSMKGCLIGEDSLCLTPPSSPFLSATRPGESQLVPLLVPSCLQETVKGVYLSACFFSLCKTCPPRNAEALQNVIGWKEISAAGSAVSLSPIFGSQSCLYTKSFENIVLM